MLQSYNKENKHKKSFKIICGFLAIMMILTQFGFLNVIAAETSLKFVYVRGEERPLKDTSINYSPLYRQATLGGNAAFCVDYNKHLPTNNSMLAYKGTMSAEALAVLVYGYPNNISSEFGLSEDEQDKIAYLTTQIAFWQVATKTGENTGAKMSTDNLIANSGFEGDANKIKDAAKKLADAAINAPYRPNPRIVLDTSSYQIIENEEFKIAGPYTPKGYDEHGNTDFTVTSVTASLVNAPSSAYICDVNGNAKNDFSMNDPIYVRARKSDTNANFTLNVTASGNKLSCGLYGDNSSANQNFATIITDPVSVSESANISWNKDTGNLNIIKQDQAGNKISGVTFEIRDSSLQRVAVATTNSSGKIELNNIPTGSYSITEISAPTGYIIDSASKSAVVAAGSTETINFTNNRAQGYLEIYKKDTNNDPIKNAVFEIYDSNNRLVQTITTNSRGVAKSNTLNLGNYTYREVDVPDNIILDTTLRSFSITSSNQTVTSTLTNDIVSGSLKITKKDEDGNYLEGVKFNILDSNRRKIDTITTDSSGVAVSKTLNPGTYYYQEISTKDKNLIVDDNEYQFTISSSDEIVSKKATNYYKKGSLKILKVDQSNNPIAGVTFEIYDENKNLIDTIVTNDKGITNTTKDLKLGTYYYKEVAAPSNIKFSSEMVKFTVKNDGQVVDITVKNEVIQGKIKITKVDTNNNPIQNATFQILDSSKNVVQTISTDENGFAISDTLNIGTYYYKEVAAPEEYIVDDTEQQFEITSSGDFVEKTVEDKLKSSKLILHKVNKDTSENMADVRFEILDSNKNIIGSVVTDQNGYAESENLSVGTYYFKEVVVPSNFVQDTNEYQFEITDSNSNVEKTVYNVMKKLPVTGSLFSTDVIIVIVISVSCILVYVIIKMTIAYIQNRRGNYY